MKRLLLILAIALPTLCAGNALPYDSLAAKAGRFYAQSEWPSALAMYDLMLDERPGNGAVLASAIVSATFAGDTAACSRLTASAAKAGLLPSPVFPAVLTRLTEQGRADAYPGYLNLVARLNPWLKRAVDASLMNYYAWRRDGSATIACADSLLRMLPANIPAMRQLADGWLDSGDIEKAAAVWSRILEIDPDNFDALTSLANARLLGGCPAGALPLLKRAYALRQTPYIEKLIESLDP